MQKWLWITGVLLANALYGQVIVTPEDVQIWQRTCAGADTVSPSSRGEQIVRVGKCLMGRPYVAHTLEGQPNEQLVVNFRQLDCTTFLETSVAAALTQPDSAFAMYAKNLQRVRYRHGVVNAYPSRLHYFSDWLYDNERKGILTEITAQIGGKPYPKIINFMSTHRTAYPALSSNAYLADIRTLEDSINRRSHYYIPKETVARIENQLQAGDIIAITTSIGGLDIVHVGFAIPHNGRIHLLHASTDEKKVVISRQPLADYLMAHKTQTGIRVARVR